MTAPNTLIEDDDQAIAFATAAITRWAVELAARPEIDAARARIDPGDGRPELTTEILWWDDIRAIHDPADGSPDTTYQPMTLGERARFARYAIEDTAAGLDRVRDEIETARAARAVAATPADRDALDGQLDALELEQRGLLRASHELTRQRAILAAEEAAAATALADARDQVTAATRARTAHVADTAAHTVWKTAVRTGSTSSIDGEAAGELGAGTDVAFVDSELDTLFGAAKDLLAHTRDRFTALREERQALALRVTEVATRLDTVRSTVTPLHHDLTAAAAAYGVAVGELRRAATRAPGALDDAVKTVAAMRAAIEDHLDGTAELLTSSQLTTIRRAATVTAASEAADLEDTRDASVDDLRDKDHTYTLARLDLLIADPDDDLSSISAQATAAADARTTLRTDQAAYASSTKKPPLDRWERAVPVQFWERYVAYLKAVAELEQLAATTPSDYADDLEAAEQDLARASYALRQHERSEAEVERQAEVAEATLATLTASSPAYELTRLRGDD